MDHPLEFKIKDEEGTQEPARVLAQSCGPGDIVWLQGELGAGKTTFARAFCKALGLKELWMVDSPTFTIRNHYPAGPGIDHLDLYRFNDPSELADIEIDDLLYSSSIKLIEWPDRLLDYPSPDPAYLVEIKKEGETERTILIHRLKSETQ